MTARFKCLEATRAIEQQSWYDEMLNPTMMLEGL
jgi:hypothetical protein